MNNKKIEALKSVINKMLTSDNYDYSKLLEKSQELDILLLVEHKKNLFIHKAVGEKFMSDFNKIINEISIFDKIYDSIRIVNPHQNEVLELKYNDEISNLDLDCCKNCVSLKAFSEEDTYFKIKLVKRRVFIIIAIPFYIKGIMLIVEMIKDVTNNLEYL